MPTIESFKKAVLVGLVGTLAMTGYTFVASHVNLPRVDLHDMLSGMFHLSAHMAWVVYLALGVFFAYLYHAHFKARMPDTSWKRGMYYAFFLWVAFTVVAMPVMGMGFFGGSFMAALGLFVGLMCYGAIVGVLYEHS